MSKTEQETTTKTTTMDDLISGDGPAEDEDDAAVEAAADDADDAKAETDDDADGDDKPAPAKAKDDPESKQAEEAKTVPLDVLLAERKRLEAERDFFKRVADEAKTPTKEAPKEDPIDFLAEPEKIDGYINRKVAEAVQNISRRNAIRTHGEAAVQEAYAALRDHGTDAEKGALIASDDPWNDVVDWNRRRVVMAEIGNDPDAWRKAERERLKKELLAEATVRDAKGRFAPPPSAAAEPNIGGRKAEDEWTGPTPLSALLDR